MDCIQRDFKPSNLYGIPVQFLLFSNEQTSFKVMMHLNTFNMEMSASTNQPSLIIQDFNTLYTTYIPRTNPERFLQITEIVSQRRDSDLLSTADNLSELQDYHRKEIADLKNFKLTIKRLRNKQRKHFNRLDYNDGMRYYIILYLKVTNLYHPTAARYRLQVMQINNERSCI